MKKPGAAKPCKDCPRTVFGPSARCPTCQAIYRTNRRADRASFPKPSRAARIRQSKKCPEHLAWIRTLPCTIRGCLRPSEAAHVRQNTGGGMGIKPGDEWVAPLCRAHHHEQHQIGHQAFDAKYSICLRSEAERLASASPSIRRLRVEV